MTQNCQRRNLIKSTTNKSNYRSSHRWPPFWFVT